MREVAECIDIKHEGVLVAYSAALSRKEHVPIPPSWMTSSGQEQEVPNPESPSAKAEQGEPDSHPKVLVTSSSTIP